MKAVSKLGLIALVALFACQFANAESDIDSAAEASTNGAKKLVQGVGVLKVDSNTHQILAAVKLEGEDPAKVAEAVSKPDGDPAKKKVLTRLTELADSRRVVSPTQADFGYYFYGYSPFVINYSWNWGWGWGVPIVNTGWYLGNVVWNNYNPYQFTYNTNYNFWGGYSYNPGVTYVVVSTFSWN